MSSATPYELRLKMLELSKDFVEQSYNIQVEHARSTWEALRMNAEQCGAKIPEFPALPEIPSLEKMLEVAAKMNNFVSMLPTKKD